MVIMRGLKELAAFDFTVRHPPFCDGFDFKAAVRPD
jgi:hypothetical protein